MSGNCSSELSLNQAKERRLIGKPPVSKTGTAGSIPAAPGFLDSGERSRTAPGFLN